MHSGRHDRYARAGLARELALPRIMRRGTSSRGSRRDDITLEMIKGHLANGMTKVYRLLRHLQ